MSLPCRTPSSPVSCLSHFLGVQSIQYSAYPILVMMVDPGGFQILGPGKWGGAEVLEVSVAATLKPGTPRFAQEPGTGFPVALGIWGGLLIKMCGPTCYAIRAE